MKYRPDACPTCGFVWDEPQGRYYGDGYEQIAANVWQCTRCRHTVHTRNGNDKRIARR